MQTADLLIIGGGPGGYVIAAERAAAGDSVILIERDNLGGTCLNRGCIPTKCLCASAGAVISAKNAENLGIRVSNLAIDYDAVKSHITQVIDDLRQGVAEELAGVTVLKGEASILADGTIAVGDQIFSASKTIIATGSAPAKLPIEGAEYAITSDEVLALDALPSSMIIIGGGVIGIEFASALSALGVQVSVVEYCPEILPGFDAEIAKRLRTSLSKRGVSITVNARVTQISADGTVSFEGKKGAATVQAECVVMAVGRKPVFPQGLDAAGIEFTPKGIVVDDKFQTTRQGFYTIGDVNGLTMLAHAATAQARSIFNPNINLDIIPGIVFSHPEVAKIFDKSRIDNNNLISLKVPFGASGKAIADGNGQGLLKLHFDSADKTIVGAEAIGAHATDLIAECSAAIYGNFTAEDLARNLIAAHPSMSELISITAAKM